MAKSIALPALPEIACIDLLESIERQFAQKFGEIPFNISHWDPSEDFHRKLLTQIDLPSLSSVINYSFSYTVLQGRRVVEKLGAKAPKRGFLLTPSGTTSIISAVNWLANQDAKELLVACPAYFPVFHACRRFGIKAEPLYLEKHEGDFFLPESISRMGDRKALFITNPVYCTGVYLPESVIAVIADLLERGWLIIADECLSLPGRELCRTLGKYENFVALYSPHKSVCTNGIKFSVLIFDQQFQALFDQWSDVLSGGLGCSTILAVDHFLSDNFQTYSEHFRSLIDLERVCFNKLCNANDIQIDTTAKGHFSTCYLASGSPEIVDSEGFLRRLVYETCGSLMFGNRSRFSQKLGVTFRVNLARSGPHFAPTLTRLIRFLKSSC
jgi:aspartate/methionine/tyrosine aminotransferase